jgi:hypothetical protein
MLANEIVKLRKYLDKIVNFQSMTVTSRVEEIPNKLAHEMLENFQINGAVPMTREQITVLLISTLDAIHSNHTELSAIKPIQRSSVFEATLLYSHMFSATPEALNYKRGRMLILNISMENLILLFNPLIVAFFQLVPTI